MNFFPDDVSSFNLPETRDIVLDSAQIAVDGAVGYWPASDQASYAMALNLPQGSFFVSAFSWMRLLGPRPVNFRITPSVYIRDKVTDEFTYLAAFDASTALLDNFNGVPLCYAGPLVLPNPSVVVLGFDISIGAIDYSLYTARYRAGANISLLAR